MSESPSNPGRSGGLAALFPGGGHRLQMRMTRGSVRDFFGGQDPSGGILAERRRWLRADAGAYCLSLPGTGLLLSEWGEVAVGAGIGEKLLQAGEVSQPALLDLGRSFEPDLLFLQAEGGEFRLVAGCVCFPSSWSLEEKIGRPLAEIHSPVPGLNAQLAAPVTQFLHRLAPGIAWCRENWGLSASPERNQHPSQRTPRLTVGATLEETWLRVERQALVSLPRSGGVCFGIRVESHPLSAVKSDMLACEGLRRALETMPSEMADYKGISAARARVVELLRG